MNLVPGARPRMNAEVIRLYHAGLPSLESGLVCEIIPAVRDPWFAFVQEGDGYATAFTIWPDAAAFILIAKGAAYFVNAEHPGQWRFIDNLAIEGRLTPDGTIALITTYEDVVALAIDGSVKWRTPVAIDGIEIESLSDNTLRGIACFEPPDDWQPFTLRLSDGSLESGTVVKRI